MNGQKRPQTAAGSKRRQSNMMNVEKSGWRKGEYVGYCNGANKIIRSGSGWRMVITLKDGRLKIIEGPLKAMQAACEFYNGK